MPSFSSFIIIRSAIFSLFTSSSKISKYLS
nr:MAG TPA: hypothetical protein [Caudoviricetes sp.]